MPLLSFWIPEISFLFSAECQALWGAIILLLLLPLLWAVSFRFCQHCPSLNEEPRQASYPLCFILYAFTLPLNWIMYSFEARCSGSLLWECPWSLVLSGCAVPKFQPFLSWEAARVTLRESCIFCSLAYLMRSVWGRGGESGFFGIHITESHSHPQPQILQPLSSHVPKEPKLENHSST